MNDRYRDLAFRLVKFIDEKGFILEDSDDEESPISQRLLRDFRKTVYAEQSDDWR